MMIASVLGMLIAGATVYRSYHVMPESHPNFEALVSDFNESGTVKNDSYAKLFQYFLQGFEYRRSTDGARSYYLGRLSEHGKEIDGLEGFSRSAPLWGAWVKSGRPDAVRLLDGSVVRLSEEFRRGLLAGTNLQSREYWGDVKDFDQRIVEASDIALSLWLFRDKVWDRLTKKDQAMVASWLNQVNGKEVRDNNWHLFPVFINVVLSELGAPHDSENAKRHYQRFKEFYRGDGWFSDGPGNLFDYYNAWGIEYQLYWIDQVSPAWDRQYIRKVQEAFIATYRYFIGPAGLPILGRSVCYRMAAPAPLIFGQQLFPHLISPGEARRGLDVIWGYFIRHHGLIDGNMTQGYCREDPRILDDYSGPASCLWGLRSLVLAFYLPQSSRFWSGPVELLPVEKKSYAVHIPSTKWQIQGDQQTGAIRIINGNVPPMRVQLLAEYGIMRRVATFILGQPYRPKNQKAKYGSRVYDSASPFCGCL